MTEIRPADLYAGNILTERLGPIPSPEDALRALLYRPPLPQQIDAIPRHLRLHHVMGVRDLHLPALIARQLLQTTDMMVRHGYQNRDPRLAATWASVTGESRRRDLRLPAAMAAAVTGLSGVGKTQACLRSLGSFPHQVITHTGFPKMVGEMQQVVWLSVEVPPSGKASDLARELMRAWDAATGGKRFGPWLAKETIRDGMRALEEWRQVAAAHFLGILHLDEIQNLFKLKSLQQRKSRTGSGSITEISIVEDQLLRWLLQLTNSGQIPLLVSGTPDGIGALSKRLSTLERLNTAGHFPLEAFSSPTDPAFSIFLKELGKYQYVKNRLLVDEVLARLIVDLTAGVPRIIIALWIAAHRVAFERKDDDLRLSDIQVAADTWLAPLAPAIAALKSMSADRLAQYEDLIDRDATLWAKYWKKRT